jgi:hypothetical protein
LFQSVSSEALAAAKLSAYEKERAYEQELLSALKSRTGKDSVLPDLISSPAGEVKIAPESKKFKLAGSAEKTKFENAAPEETPGTLVAPAPVAAFEGQTKPVVPSVLFEKPETKSLSTSPSDGSVSGTAGTASNLLILVPRLLLSLNFLLVNILNVAHMIFV